MPSISSLKIAIDSSEVKKAQDELNKLGSTAGSTEKQTKSLTSSFSALGAVISVGAIYGLAREFVKISDTMTNANSKLKLVTSSTQELVTAQKALFDIAQNTRTSFTGNIDLYQKMAMSTKDLNLSQKDMLGLISSINKSLVISGTNAAGAETLITQLGQAFSSNFQGVAQELATIRDQAPSLYQEILKGTGMTGAAFKKAAEDGRLSSQIIIDALKKQGVAIDENFGKVGVTVDSAMTTVYNSISKMVGEVDTEINGSGGFASIMQDMSSSMDKHSDIVAKTAGRLSNEVSTRFNGMSSAIGFASASVLYSATSLIENTVNGWYNAFNWAMYGINRLKGMSEEQARKETIKLIDVGASGYKDMMKGYVAEMDAIASKYEAYKPKGTSGKIDDSSVGKGSVNTKIEKETKEEKAARLKAEKERQKALEEEAKIQRGYLESYAELQANAAIEQYNIEVGYITDKADLQAKSAIALFEMTQSEADKINEKMLELFNTSGHLFSEEQLTIFFAKWNEELDNIKVNAIDTSDFIKFDNEGINKHIALMVNGFDKMAKAEKQYNANRAKYAKGTKQYQDNEDEYVSSQIAGYANLAGAMSAMFEQGSSEAKAFQAVQTALAIVEGVSATIKQLNSGDPYTAIPRAVAVGAMVASLLQTIGVGGTKTSTSSDAFSAMSANEGKGSVFGDTSAQSESIIKSMDIMADLAKPEFRLISQMNISLKSIDSKIGGMTSLLLRQGGFAMGEGYEGFDTGMKLSGSKQLAGEWLTSGIIGQSVKLLDPLVKDIPIIGDLNKMLGGIVSGLGSFVGGGLFGKTSVSQSMKDSGIYFGDALLMNAKEQFEGSAYQTISTTVSKKSWFKKSSSTTIKTYFAGLNDEMERQFSLVLSGLYDTTVMAGQALDTSSTEIENSLSSFVVSIGKISLMGKSGDQIQETLSAVFGRIADDIAKKAFPLLIPFQKVGEGLFETMTRVSAGMEESKYYIDRLGASFDKIKYTDIVNQQGNVGLEALRQSIIKFDEATYGANNGVVQMVESLDVATSELYDIYRLFGAMRIAIEAMGQESQYLSSEMLRGAGGVEELSDGISDYMDSFFSDAEKIAYSTKLMTAEFEAAGITMPKTSDEFKSLIKSIDLSTQSGQELYGRLIILSNGFSELQDSIKNSDIGKLFADITEFVASLRTDIVSRDASTSFSTFSTSFNAMVDAIASGADDVYTIGTKAIDNAKSYLSTVTATATASRDIAFAKAVIANKFESVTLAPEITMSTLNDTIKFSLNENSAIITELRALRSEVVYLNSLNLTQTATQVKTLSATRALIA